MPYRMRAAKRGCNYFAFPSPLFPTVPFFDISEHKRYRKGPQGEVL